MVTTLNENWLTEGLIDFEYKKYVLLAYLKSVEQHFTSNKLYPHLADLVNHYQNLQKLLRQKAETNQFFPRRLEKIDLQNFVLSYEQTIKDDALMQEIEKIIDFSIPTMRRYLEEGKEIYEWIEDQLQLRPVGIVPLELMSGYLFLRNGGEKATEVYLYQLTLFERAEEKYRGMMTQYISTYEASITHTYERMKQSLIEKQRLLVAPAVYVVESEVQFPFSETLLPIAKRVLVRYLAAQSV